MSCEKIEMTLISLSDDVLLHIFKLLNWIDSINLAATCKRMKNLKYWDYKTKQSQEFDLNKFVEQAAVPIGKVLSVIGPYIRIAKITEQVMSKSFMEKCFNIKSLKIDGCISRSAAIVFNTWMKELKIESISIGHEFEDNVEELLQGIEGLNTFAFDSFQKLLPSDFFNKNSTIQHLSLTQGDDFELSLDLSSLVVLQNLQSLFLTTERTAVLDDVHKYIKMGHLKEFSMYILESNMDEYIWNNFAEYLAKNTKLDKLRMIGCIDIDEETFSTLKLFNLTSLCLEVRFSWKDFSSALCENAAPRLKYLRLDWPISWCNYAKIGHVLKMWTTVEAICLNANDESDLLFHFKDEFYSNILTISNDRPGLTLHIFSSEVSYRRIFENVWINNF